MASLKGYSAPRSPEGRSSLVPAPPWHYVGDMLVIEFWADPAAAAAVLPEPLEPHPDGGRAAAMFLDWQSCSDGGAELLDPARSQYKEFFITVNALYEGEEVADCPYIWVERDFALARGWIQRSGRRVRKDVEGSTPSSRTQTASDLYRLGRDPRPDVEAVARLAEPSEPDLSRKPPVLRGLARRRRWACPRISPGPEGLSGGRAGCASGVAIVVGPSIAI